MRGRDGFFSFATFMIGTLVDGVIRLQTRWRCVRWGHRFFCLTDGHCCQRCGRFWA